METEASTATAGNNRVKTDDHSTPRRAEYVRYESKIGSTLTPPGNLHSFITDCDDANWLNRYIPHSHSPSASAQYKPWPKKEPSTPGKSRYEEHKVEIGSTVTTPGKFHSWTTDFDNKVDQFVPPTYNPALLTAGTARRGLAAAGIGSEVKSLKLHGPATSAHRYLIKKCPRIDGIPLVLEADTTGLPSDAEPPSDAGPPSGASSSASEWAFARKHASQSPRTRSRLGVFEEFITWDSSSRMLEGDEHLPSSPRPARAPASPATLRVQPSCGESSKSSKSKVKMPAEDDFTPVPRFPDTQESSITPKANRLSIGGNETVTMPFTAMARDKSPTSPSPPTSLGNLDPPPASPISTRNRRSETPPPESPCASKSARRHAV